MKDYTYKEIGMLLGVGIGGAIAVAGFYISSNALFFTFALIGIALGIYFGNIIDKRRSINNVDNKFINIK
jgi:uncharacterized membrane protein